MCVPGSEVSPSSLLHPASQAHFTGEQAGAQEGRVRCTSPRGTGTRAGPVAVAVAAAAAAAGPVSLARLKVRSSGLETLPTPSAGGGVRSILVIDHHSHQGPEPGGPPLGF